jgi:Ran GTPase-activating protein (RanGAP) involved in mRNA processing and transport
MALEATLDYPGYYLWAEPTYIRLDTGLSPDVAELNMSTCHIDSRSAQLIATAVASPKSRLHTLLLRHCRVGTSVLGRLFGALASSRVRVLSLDGNVLTGESCAALSSALRVTPVLETLSICDCNLVADDFAIIGTWLPSFKSLRQLSLDDNSLLNHGAMCIAENVPTAPLVRLSIARNRIWSDGTSALLGASRCLRGLDLSGNAVDLRVVAGVICESSSLSELSVSDCRVNQRDIPFFLEKVAESRLVVLAMEGFDTRTVAARWDKLRDATWADPRCFNALLMCLVRSPSLRDVRLGFLGGVELFNLIGVLADRPGAMSISLSDFGRSDTVWVLHFPLLSAESPLPTMKWAAGLRDTAAATVSHIFLNATCVGAPLSGIDLSGVDMNDRDLENFLGGFAKSPVFLEFLDLSCNPVRSVRVLQRFFQASSARRLVITGTKLTSSDFANLFETFVERGIALDRLCFSFLTDEDDETLERPFSDSLSTLVGTSGLMELEINGFITAPDLWLIIRELRNNRTLTSIVVTQRGVEGGGDHTMSIQVARKWKELVVEVQRVAPICVLQRLIHPRLVAFLAQDDEAMQMWVQIETVFSQDRTA